MSDHTLYDTTVPTAGSVALAHQDIIRVKRNGVFENITGDVNNLLDTKTPVTVQREVYGTKGVQSSDIIGYNHVLTFSVEAVRDDTGAIAQPWLVELLKVSGRKGAANKLDAQLFDALDGNLPAIEGSFSVASVKGNTGYADKAVWNFTLTSDGIVDEIVSPVASGGEPVLESALPTDVAVGKNVVVRGYNLSGATSATIGGVEATSITVIDTNIIVLEVPAGAAGSAPIIVTNPVGASTALAYVRGA